MATAYVLINCDLGYEEQIIEELKHISDVKKSMELLVPMTFLPKLNQMLLKNLVKQSLGRFAKYQKFVSH